MYCKESKNRFSWSLIIISHEIHARKENKDKDTDTFFVMAQKIDQ
jgi:hypothetical protein